MAAVQKKPRLDEAISGPGHPAFGEVVSGIPAPRLPDEVLLLILEKVKANADRFSLLRVCQQWHMALRREVYSKLVLTTSELPLFLNAVQSNPQLGAFVREIAVPTPRLEENPPTYDSPNDPRLFANESRVEGRVRVAWLWGSPMARDVIYHEEREETLLARLLPYLANVKKLQLRFTDYDNQPAAYAVSQIAVRKQGLPNIPLALHHLRECSIIGGPRPSSALGFYPFFHLPQMRVFRASRLYDFPHKDPSAALWRALRVLMPRPWNSGIREIHFEELCCSTRGCQDFIMACKRLEVFEYQHTRYITAGGLGFSFHARPFRNSLFWHKDTLRVLRLNDKGETEHGRWRHDAEKAHWFGSLEEFEALEELWMPLRSLLDFQGRLIMTNSPIHFDELLPTSLRYLFVADMCEGDIELINRNVLSVLEARTQFLFLNKIVLQFASPWMEEGVMMSPATILKTHFSKTGNMAQELSIDLEVEMKPAQK